MSDIINTGALAGTELVRVQGNIGGRLSPVEYVVTTKQISEVALNGGTIGAGATLVNNGTISGGHIDGAIIGAGSAVAGSFSTLTVSTDAGLILTGQTSDAGALTATMTNAPHATDPIFWAKISVNGTAGTFPIWAV